MSPNCSISPPHPRICTSSRRPPSPPSSRSNSPTSFPPGFVFPPNPPLNCPFRECVGFAEDGMPTVSDSPVRSDDPLVEQVMMFRADPSSPCAHCRKHGNRCEFVESGSPCPTCLALGVPDCRFADPDYFLLNLVEYRNRHLHDKCDELVGQVNNGTLDASLFDQAYHRIEEEFYRVAQGAIVRFGITHGATNDLTRRGFHLLALSVDDPEVLAQLIAACTKTGLHPDVLVDMSTRLRDLYLS
ncbi:hypothetical protein FB45DRAFT_1066997 [Roridomyces roridus]|uniref:Zn(2)-C6 fungal-type domain-containing protein n=1 Tax=Roridomyces roridus TaxID=1738132 RepID=A0AAD7FB16_9AGAR|nr:hypothetical protein FB45DRAFT_1066997 [Roridomyces roridus]